MMFPTTPRHWVHLLRITSLTEGVSFLLLLFVAMPLKYVWHWPVAVKYVGWAHGGLFVFLGLLVLITMARAKLPFKTAFIVGLASVLPAGPFFADRRLKQHEKSLCFPIELGDTDRVDL